MRTRFNRPLLTDHEMSVARDRIGCQLSVRRTFSLAYGGEGFLDGDLKTKGAMSKREKSDFLGHTRSM